MPDFFGRGNFFVCLGFVLFCLFETSCCFSPLLGDGFKICERLCKASLRVLLLLRGRNGCWWLLGSFFAAVNNQRCEKAQGWRVLLCSCSHMACLPLAWFAAWLPLAWSCYMGLWWCAKRIWLTWPNWVKWKQMCFQLLERLLGTACLARGGYSDFLCVLLTTSYIKCIRGAEEDSQSFGGQVAAGRT